jgi:hypothetical protein
MCSSVVCRACSWRSTAAAEAEAAWPLPGLEAEAEAEGVRARAARTAAESSYVRLTPEEARARGFRDDEELVMPMPVDDSSDEED